MTDKEFEVFLERCTRTMNGICDILIREGFTIEGDTLVDWRQNVGNTGYHIPEALDARRPYGHPTT